MLAVFVYPAQGQTTRNAASCSAADIQAAVNLSADGDIVQVPACTTTWTGTSAVSVSGKGITIKGTGTPNTTPSTSGASSSCASGTVLTDELTGGSMFVFTPTFGNSTTRLSCMKISPFIPRSGYGIPIQALGTCTSSGCPDFRMDNMTIPSAWSGIGVSDDTFMGPTNVFGVADHNTVGDVAPGGNGVVLANVAHGSWKGVNHWGDNSWASADSFGTNQAFYLENNTFNFGIGTDTDIADQNHGGGRYVCRFNTFNNVEGTGACANHGNDTGGRIRGGRQVEAYYNTGSQASGSTAFGSRSGVGIIFGNTWTNSTGAFGKLANLDPQRRWRPNKFSACDGSTVWDTNDGTTYYSGTIGSFTSIGSAAPNGIGWVITDSGAPGWSANQWVQNGAPYSIHDVTKTSGAEITATASSTNNVSVPDQTHGYNPSNADSYQILRATVCMDQPARSGGQLLKGGDCSGTVTEGTACPVLSATGNPGAVAESIDPWYEGADTLPGTATQTIGAATASIIANRDFYAESVNQAAQSNATTPFNGTSGSGHGTLANRPTTCTTGVGYFAMDQGSWNNFNSQKGVLYICTSTNTWTLSYTPFTYPHPLIAGTPAPIAIFTPSSINIGQVPQNMTSNPSQTVTLTNTGTANLVATQITTTNVLYSGLNNTCGASSTFSLVSPGAGFTLTPGSNCTFQVTFSPTGIGTFGGAVQVFDNTVTTPDSLILSGTSTGPPAPTPTVFAAIYK